MVAHNGLLVHDRMSHSGFHVRMIIDGNADKMKPGSFADHEPFLHES